MTTRSGSIVEFSGRRPGVNPTRVDPLLVLRQLTGRDRLLVDLLAEHRVLTTEQVTAVGFGAATTARHRLAVLHRLGVLDRFRLAVPGGGSQSWRYTLGPTGAAIVAAARGVDPPRPGAHRARVLRLATSPTLDHLLGVNGVFTALLADARTRPGVALVAWESEAACAARLGGLARPDGHGVWAEAGRQVGFWLEYDTGTERLDRLTGKLPGYRDVARALADTDGRADPVLFWLPNTAREAHLHRALTASPPPVPVATAAGDHATAAGHSPAGPIWLPAGTARGGGRRRLIDLPTTTAAGRTRPAA
jgi:hypothetical protein